MNQSRHPDKRRLPAVPQQKSLKIVFIKHAGFVVSLKPQKRYPLFFFSVVKFSPNETFDVTEAGAGSDLEAASGRQGDAGRWQLGPKDLAEVGDQQRDIELQAHASCWREAWRWVKPALSFVEF